MEIYPKEIIIESLAAPLPIDREARKGHERSSIDQRIDYRWIDLRTEANQLMFKAQTTMINAMRQFLLERSFMEIHTPKLIAAASESGADVFEVKYFDRKAYLAQSPQFYKQMAMASGFERISTPMLEDMENLDKSDGGDNLNLIFKVLKRGDKLTAALNSGDPKELSDMGLRYDLTLPLSRFYAANKDKLPHPFKVIQTDRVFRAERPQKGRLREFVQCDIDILGDESPNAEVELIDVTTRALLGIGFDGFTVNINDRRILRGMLESMGFAADTLDSVCITFDKMDKIGAEGVKAELTEKQLPESAIQALADFIAAGDVTLDAVAARCADPAIADDLKYVLATANTLAAGRYQVAYCPSLVRGQGYYTGMVFEVTCPQFSGAVAGGGRYDNMVGKFLGVQVPAVGFSIGFERVCGILLEQGYQIPGAKQKIALLYGKDTDFPAVLSKAAALREQYNVTVLPQGKKLGKQLGQLEAAGFAGAAFMDKDEVKIFAQQ